jgi:hypothetical protein
MILVSKHHTILGRFSPEISLYMHPSITWKSNCTNRVTYININKCCFIGTAYGQLTVICLMEGRYPSNVQILWRPCSAIWYKESPQCLNCIIDSVPEHGKHHYFYSFQDIMLSWRTLVLRVWLMNRINTLGIWTGSEYINLIFTFQGMAWNIEDLRFLRRRLGCYAVCFL